MKQYIFIAIILFLITGCKEKCQKTNYKFSNYGEVIHLIEKTDFTFSDKCNTKKSSWIVSAEYYSCDSKKGFFILKTKKGAIYIHQNLPKNLWYQFKSTKSFGKFYNKKIKNKYQLIL